MKSTKLLAIRSIVAGLLAVLALGCNRSGDQGPVANPDTVKKISEVLMAGKSSGGAEQAVASTGTGWATIKGQFLFDGDPPKMPPYDVTKEHEICSVNGQAPPQETLVVSPSKGIKNVVVFLRDASRVNDSAKAKTDPVVFDQKHCVFLSHVAGATVGQTLDIKNSDPTGHNTNIQGAGFNQLIPSGGDIGMKVTKENQTPDKVVCSIHPWMTAYLVSRKNGYFAITDADGKFEIPNVPADEPLEFQVWHESGAAAGGGLVGTTPDAADLKWSNRGRLAVKLKPDETREVKVVVPPKAFKM